MKQKDGMERGLFPREMLSLRIILEPTSVQMVVLGKRTLRILDRRVVRPGFLPVLKNAPIQVHVLVLDVGVRGNAPALESFRDILRQHSAHPTESARQRNGTVAARRSCRDG